MKATFDLPAELVQELKLRAARDGRKLEETAAAALRAGLAAGRGGGGEEKAALVRRDRKTGLPLIRCLRAAGGGGRKEEGRGGREEMTADRVAAILLEQESGWAHDSGGQ